MNSKPAGNNLFRSMSLIFLIPGMICCSCKGRQEKKIQYAEQVIAASLLAVGTKENRERISNIFFLADCVSPQGRYTTEVHTAAGGYTYFKQLYSYKPAAFEAIVYNRASGVETGNPVKQLNGDAIYTIRGHAFVNTILEVDQRFHDFQQPEMVTADSMRSYRLKAKDELDHPCYLFFDETTNLFTALQIQDPANEKEVIIIRFSGWKRVQELQAPHRIEINQGDKVFTFDLTRIVFNDPGFQKKSINEKQ